MTESVPCWWTVRSLALPSVGSLQDHAVQWVCSYAFIITGRTQKWGAGSKGGMLHILVEYALPNFP
jgi:hypothetical protein